MKGNQYAAKGGMSRVYHYELTGAARVDYRFNPEYIASQGDKHRVVQIVLVALGSH
ncbi:hypothetical protein [Pimelobacter simplex]|uniref:hypothetical protein n=1 Tax=Nocardioides simplex TaxID=2045 RepID=UPI0019324795|nr:hypothetical protein [Pimelobacter simplex]